MRIDRRWKSLVVAGALLAATGLAGTAGASTPPPNAVGTITCQVKGSIKFKPPLLGYEGHAVNSTTVTLSTSEFGCSGTGDAANIVKGASKTSRVSESNDCATVLQQPLQTDGSSGALKWTVLKGTQKWAPSMIAFTSATKGGDGINTPYTIDLAGSSTSGSFNGDNAASHAQIKQTFAQIAKACLNTKVTGGLKSLTIVAPPSSFALSN